MQQQPLSPAQPEFEVSKISTVTEPVTVTNRQYLVTPEMYLMGRIREADLSATNKSNMDNLLVRINMLFDTIEHKPVITSGYRTEAINKQAGGSPKSAHLSCEAIDLADTYGKLSYYLSQNQHLLSENELYMESPANTPGWTHLQIRPTRNRIFKP